MTAVQQLLSIVLAFGIPALIAAWMPRRWRVAALILWVLSPVILLLALGGIEAARNPAEADLGKLLYGLALIGSILALPWLLACLIGFALGSLLRRKRAAHAPAAPAATPPATPPPRPAPGGGGTLSLQPVPRWHAAHVGTERDGLVLDGLDIWALPWRRERSPQVTLPHPAHPAEMHAYTVYSVDDGRAATRFAAAELSNGVWGFYRWIIAVDAAATDAHREGTSPAQDHTSRQVAPDGSVLVELAVVEWANTHWVHSPRVTDLTSGRTLLDLWGTDWDAVAEFPRGRMVRLALRAYRSGAQLAATLDLATGRYALEGRPESGAIAELPALLARAAQDAAARPAAARPAIRPAPRRAYGVAFLILAGALLTIAGATLVTLRLSPDPPPRKLDRIPEMPRPR